MTDVKVESVTVMISEKQFSFSPEALSNLNAVIQREDVFLLKSKYNRETETYEMTIDDKPKPELRPVTMLKWTTAEQD